MFYYYNTIITCPSSNELNTQFLHRLNKIIKSKSQITDYLHKLTATEVYEDFVNWGQIDIDYKEKSNKIKETLTKFLNKMHKANDGYFSYKFIKDVNLRKYITKTIYSDNETSIEYAPYINDKRILILDDTIASGKTISGVCEEIFEMFTPKSATVITLFSKL